MTRDGGGSARQRARGASYRERGKQWAEMGRAVRGHTRTREAPEVYSAMVDAERQISVVESELAGCQSALAEHDARARIDAQGPAPDLSKFSAYVQDAMAIEVARLRAMLEMPGLHPKTYAWVRTQIGRAQRTLAEAVELVAERQAPPAESSMTVMREMVGVTADLAHVTRRLLAERRVVDVIPELPALPDAR